MLFNSLKYLVFLLVVVVVHFRLKPQFRWVLLLCASYYFYVCWRPEYILLIVLSSTVDFLSCLGIRRTTSAHSRRAFLALSLTVNLGMLFLFKYHSFFHESIAACLEIFNVTYHFNRLDVLLPVGISFYTFQTMGYTIDVYRGHREPEEHPGLFALYVSFFPQLVAGPIERSERLLPQFRRESRLHFGNIVSGLKLIIRGLSKKIIVADILARVVDQVYATPEAFDGVALLLATYFFALQIYCDFSGYSDIAIGSARVLGISLMENFRRPYFSASIEEFWGRWHISLSTWFRDYFYIPLGGSRVGRLRGLTNVLMAFLVSGLWHGANWTFVIWGALHGCFVVSVKLLGLSRPPRPPKDALPFWSVGNLLRVIFTFHMVLLGWIFFRAENIDDAVGIVRNILTLSETGRPFPFALGLVEQTIVVFVIVALLLRSLCAETGGIASRLRHQTVTVLRCLFYAALINCLIFTWGESDSFIYFQF